MKKGHSGIWIGYTYLVDSLEWNSEYLHLQFFLLYILLKASSKYWCTFQEWEPNFQIQSFVIGVEAEIITTDWSLLLTGTILAKFELDNVSRSQFIKA